MAQFQLGSISSGTLRIKDLLPAFVDALLGIDNVNGGQTHGYPFTYQNAWDSDYAADSYWNSSYPTEDLEIVSILLNELCPPFVFFGTLPGDSADFGFWINHDGMVEANIDGLDKSQADGVVVVQYSDHHNAYHVSGMMDRDCPDCAEILRDDQADR